MAKPKKAKATEKSPEQLAEWFKQANEVFIILRDALLQRVINKCVWTMTPEMGFYSVGDYGLKLIVENDAEIVIAIGDPAEQQTGIVASVFISHSTDFADPERHDLNAKTPRMMANKIATLLWKQLTQEAVIICK